jgi:hypothetical protein
VGLVQVHGGVVLSQLLEQLLHEAGVARQQEVQRELHQQLRDILPPKRRRGKLENSSVADPDPNPNPHDFGPPGSGSISQRYGSGSSCKNSKENLDSCYFVTPFDFLSLKKDVNVPSKSNKQKK